MKWKSSWRAFIIFVSSAMWMTGAFAQERSDSVSPAVPLRTPEANNTVAPLTLDEAVQLALKQASQFQQAAINERVVAEDVRQARAAFLPRVAAMPSLIATTPALGANAPGTPRPPSFIGANAITEYQGLVNVAGELDIGGRLRATLKRNQALLEAARAGTSVARRALILAVEDAYNNLALAITARRSADQSLAAAAEFERITNLLLSGGEVAPVDATRARLQTTARRDELERARAAESAVADALRIFIGYDFTQPVATTDLVVATPEAGEIEGYAAGTITARPEFRQFVAERRAAEQDIRLARAERRPQFTYSINGGSLTDSLRPSAIGTHTGASASVGVAFPLFDGGASRSRERQARLRAEAAENARAVATKTFAQEFYTARAQAISAVARIRLASTGIRDAEQNVEASIARYRAGEASIIEVTDAQSILIAQRSALYQAIFDYQFARSRLRRATGQ
ncbi:MAG: TolC family protein [Pyrinomonadaceae bacterium]|nr:TolC family protein [Pyrinomonadaceae bacterium]